MSGSIKKLLVVKVTRINTARLRERDTIKTTNKVKSRKDDTTETGN